MITIYLTYALLFALCALYAVALHQLKQRLEPDFTWLEVVLGTALVLAAPATLARLGELRTWADYEAAVWAGFIVGGLPIVVWQLWLAWARRDELIAYLRERRDEQRAKALADPGGGGAAGHGGNGAGDPAAGTRGPGGDPE